MHEAFCYKELLIGSPSERRRARIINWNDFTSVPNGEEAYASLNYFDYTMVEYFNRLHTVAGFRGPVWSDALVLDFDGEGPDYSDKAHNAAQDVLEFAAYLKRAFDHDLKHVYFSGGKGFHVLLPGGLFGGFEPSADLPEKQRALAVELTSGAGVAIDTTLYNATRIFRLVNTVHAGTGLYKVPVTLDEVLKGWLT